MCILGLFVERLIVGREFNKLLFLFFEGKCVYNKGDNLIVEFYCYFVVFASKEDI